MRIIYLLILISLNLQALASVKNLNWCGKVLSTNNTELKFVHLQVVTQTTDYLFMTDKDGLVKIDYPNFTDIDTLIISCIGYQTKRINCIDLIKHLEIRLENEIYQIGEISIKAKKTKSYKLGNLIKHSFRSSQIGFSNKAGLFIPYNGESSKLKSIRVYMHSFGNKSWKYRPFLVRLYKGHFPFKEEITPKVIIAALEPNKNHWVSIDLSQYGLDFPKEGLLVAVQAFSADYYLKHGYIKSKYINGNISNSIGLGATTGDRTKLNIEGWNHKYYTNKWKQRKGVLRNPMIQAEVIPTK
ncbi:hypothetical protein ACXR6G_03455 [Ancylomarina sp. YFZ004]